MNISAFDQETILRFGRTSEEMNIWTSDSTIMTRLDKIYPSTPQHDTEGTIVAKVYKVDKKLLTFRSDPSIRPDYKPKRILTELNLVKMLNARPNIV